MMAVTQERVQKAYAALGTQVCCGQCRCAAQDIIDTAKTSAVQPVLLAAE